jgi:hypothetical protein
VTSSFFSETLVADSAPGGSLDKADCNQQGQKPHRLAARSLSSIPLPDPSTHVALLFRVEVYLSAFLYLFSK